MTTAVDNILVRHGLVLGRHDVDSLPPDGIVVIDLDDQEVAAVHVRFDLSGGSLDCKGIRFESGGQAVTPADSTYLVFSSANGSLMPLKILTLIADDAPDGQKLIINSGAASLQIDFIGNPYQVYYDADINAWRVPDWTIL